MFYLFSLWCICSIFFDLFYLVLSVCSVCLWLDIVRSNVRRRVETIRYSNLKLFLIYFESWICPNLSRFFLSLFLTAKIIQMFLLKDCLATFCANMLRNWEEEPKLKKSLIIIKHTIIPNKLKSKNNSGYCLSAGIEKNYATFNSNRRWHFLYIFLHMEIKLQFN